MVYPSITVCPLYSEPEYFRPFSSDIVADYNAMDEEKLIVGMEHTVLLSHFRIKTGLLYFTFVLFCIQK